MPEEFFDLVDENNNLLGVTKSRSQVHKDGDWHRTVHMYVCNEKGEYLVHLRSKDKDLHPNKWSACFGGHVRTGAGYDQTVVTELYEEIGLQVPIHDFTPGKIHSYDGATNREFVKIYYYTYTGDIKGLRFNDNEVVEVKWMTPVNINNVYEKDPSLWTPSTKRFSDRIFEATNL